MTDTFNLIDFININKEFSEKTYGPGFPYEGVLDHISKEMSEIRNDPHDLEEWIDIIILAIDGAWRSGASANDIASMLKFKQIKNMNRVWPDWRTVDRSKAIEHDRTGE